MLWVVREWQQGWGPLLNRRPILFLDHDFDFLDKVFLRSHCLPHSSLNRLLLLHVNLGVEVDLVEVVDAGIIIRAVSIAHQNCRDADFSFLDCLLVIPRQTTLLALDSES